MHNQLPKRKSPRLTDYDYSLSGAYFVTICTNKRTHLFGDIHADEMQLNTAGRIAHEHWLALPRHHSNITISDFVVMPNHIHGILLLDGASGSLSTIVGSYKSGVTRRIRQTYQQPSLIVWQGRYHDHIIRSEQGMNKIREYIQYNPALWQQDTFYDEV